MASELPSDAIAAPAKPEAVSALMRRFRDMLAGQPEVRVGQILQIFGLRGFAVLFLTLALLNIVIFMVPLISVIFGLPMILLSAQIVLGIQTPMFPRLIREYTLQTPLLVAGIDRAVHWLEKTERYVKPRLCFLSHPILRRVHGVMALGMAIMVTMPLPLFNVPPSIALAILAIGLLQRDGFLITASYMIAFWCLLIFKSLGHLAHHLGTTAGL